MTLSDKIQIMNLNPVIHGIDPEDVKEFIKELKKQIKSLEDYYDVETMDIIFRRIDKLAGDKLI